MSKLLKSYRSRSELVGPIVGGPARVALNTNNGAMNANN